MKKEKMINKMTIAIQDLNRIHQLERTTHLSEEFSEFRGSRNEKCHYIDDNDSEDMKMLKESVTYSKITEYKKDPKLYADYQEYFGKEITDYIERILPKIIPSTDKKSIRKAMRYWY